MSLEPGTHLGPYEILGKLGEGGMGEVYRARDTKLNREVALKILPEAFTADDDRLARFKREAQVLASLNHPNIAAIYGFEDSGATHALVMELVDGEDLSALVARGPLPVPDALPIARQIVDALEAAHEAGIIHRDLKPANIKVRADGTVKVLDFGLAKALDPGTSGPQDLANSPTLTARATQMGMIIGTAAYMAPEQAKGRPVDRRADIWAFGVVLYEMLTGRRAFGAVPADEEASIVEVLASVLHHEVEWGALPEDLSAPVRRLLRRCLEKDPRRRLSAIGDARLELDESDGEPAVVTVSAQPPGRQRTLGIALAIVAGLWLLTLIPVARSYLATPDAPPPTSFVLAPFQGEPLRLNTNQPELGISHDGRRIVYGHGDDDSDGLVLRSLAGFGDVTLADLGELPRSPFFSPDDQWIGYYSGAASGAGGRLMKVPVSGGRPFEIAPTPGNLRGASWGPDDTIVFAGGAASGLMRVPAAGGAVEQLTVPSEADDEFAHRWPAVMPDGKHVVFAISRRGAEGAGANSFDLAVLDLATRQWRVLLPGGSYPKYVAPGYLVYVNAQGIFAARFDPVAVALRGQAVRVVGDVSIKPTSGAASFDISDNGTLAYIAGASRNTQSLAWLDRGVVTPIPGQPHSYTAVDVSPSETRAAVLINDDGSPAVWVQDLSRGALMQVSALGDMALSPVWSHDEKFVYYRSSSGIYRASADGIGTPQLIFESTRNVFPAGTTPDGTSLLVVTRDEGAGAVLQILSLDGKADLTPLVAESGRNVSSGTVSPDGRWLAYTSGVGATSGVFIRSYPGVNDKRVQVSTGSGGRPVWSRKGSTLFWQGGDAVWSVAVAPDGSLGQAVTMVEPGAAGYLGRDSYVTPSGRIINIQPAVDTTATNELRLVLNWNEVLKQQVR